MCCVEDNGIGDLGLEELLDNFIYLKHLQVLNLSTEQHIIFLYHRSVWI